MRCLLPSFVADFVQVSSWLIIDSDESSEISLSQENFGNGFNELLLVKSPTVLPSNQTLLFYLSSSQVLKLLSFSQPPPVVKQYFEIQVYDVFVMRGNTAIFKCQIPSFVSDHVDLTEWTSTENDTYKFGNEYGSIS